MLLGFQYLVLVALLFYALSAIGLWRAEKAAVDEPSPDPMVAEV
jgi:hypothetical protein